MNRRPIAPPLDKTYTGLIWAFALNVIGIGSVAAIEAFRGDLTVECVLVIFAGINAIWSIEFARLRSYLRKEFYGA